MAEVTAPDPLTTRVLAPNPSLMTLEGTNTYLLGSPGSGVVVCVDPGPEEPTHLAAVEAAASARDAEIGAVLVTHHHADHAEAAARWARSWDAPLRACDPGLVPGAEALSDGDVVSLAGLRLEALHTPGHASDHLCLRVAETGAVLTGDHVLGRGTTVVAWPDGDMLAYVDSLHRLAGLDAPVLYPGHGPTVTDPARVVEGYIEHRREREREVLAALAAGASTPAEIVAEVYRDVDSALHSAAERSVRANLDKLVVEGRVRRRPGPDGEERFDA